MSANDLDNNALEHYSRHILLDEFGIEGQQQLEKSHVVVIGLGGLGCPAALYLATCGVGTLQLVDDDKIERSNLQRQILFTEKDIDRYKVAVAANSLKKINANVVVIENKSKVDSTNLSDLLARADVVLDCTDNFETRYLINNECCKQKINLVSGAAEQFDGHVVVFAFKQTPKPCYACLFPPTENTVEPTPCSQLGVFAPLTGLIGAQMATETIRLMALPKNSEGLTSKMLAVDLLNQRFRKIDITPSTNCKVCNLD